MSGRRASSPTSPPSYRCLATSWSECTRCTALVSSTATSSPATCCGGLGSTPGHSLTMAAPRCLVRFWQNIFPSQHQFPVFSHLFISQDQNHCIPETRGGYSCVCFWNVLLVHTAMHRRPPCHPRSLIAVPQLSSDWSRISCICAWGHRSELQACVVFDKPSMATWHTYAIHE